MNISMQAQTQKLIQILYHPLAVEKGHKVFFILPHAKYFYFSADLR